MTRACLRLTVYFGERARIGGRFLADALIDIYTRHHLKVSLVMRGIEGFGTKHQMRTDQLLSLSEDLPMVAIAVDHEPEILAALQDLRQLTPFNGLVTIEPASLLEAGGAVPSAPDGDARLTVFLGRWERLDHRSAAREVVALLHRRGLAAATVLAGIDGTVDGVRQRGRFFSRNPEVPAMVMSIGEGIQVSAAAEELLELLGHPLLTIEDVRICAPSLVTLPVTQEAAQAVPSDMVTWEKLMVYASEQTRHGRRPLHRALVEELHRAGAAGATSLRGTWGYTGHEQPHGDALWQIRRRAPILVTIIDTPQQMPPWIELVNRLTDETAPVTSEHVPILQTSSGPSPTQH